jgi:hypothetical protein
MEAEYSALSMAMREGILKITVELTLWPVFHRVKLLRSKHSAIRLNWFHSHLDDKTINVPIRSEDQKADILTNGLKGKKFVEIRKLLCGW